MREQNTCVVVLDERDAQRRRKEMTDETRLFFVNVESLKGME
jgi:hypothetical protein